MTVLTTLRKKHQTYVEWNIEKFFDLPKDIDYFVESDPFSISVYEWSIRIYPNGRKDFDNPGCIGVHLTRVDSGEKVSADFEVGFKKIDGSKFKAYQSDAVSEDKTSLYGLYNFELPSTAPKLKHSLAPGGTVTVFCIVSVGDSIQVPPEIPLTEGDGKFSEQFRAMLYNQSFTDVSVSVRGYSKPAHKSILAARSYAFSNMFSSMENMKSVELCDCDPNSFEDFLIFLYTGKSSIVTSSNAMSLYRAANKYEVGDLKEECVRCMSEQPLDVETFCDFLLSANVRGDSDKRDAAADFFFDNAKAILSSSKWETFTVVYPSMSRELFYMFVEKGEKKSDSK